jgi:hypothetical protein
MYRTFARDTSLIVDMMPFSDYFFSLNVLGREIGRITLGWQSSPPLAQQQDDVNESQGRASAEFMFNVIGHDFEGREIMIRLGTGVYEKVEVDEQGREIVVIRGGR